jgi:hypothetical protein
LVVSAHKLGQPQILFALSLFAFFRAFIFAVGAFMARSRACL